MSQGATLTLATIYKITNALATRNFHPVTEHFMELTIHEALLEMQLRKSARA